VSRDKVNALARALEEAAVYHEKSLRPESCACGGDLRKLFAIDRSCGGDFDADGVTFEEGDEVDFAAVIGSKVRDVPVIVPNGAKVTVDDCFENPSLELGIFRSLGGEGEQQAVIRGVDLGMRAKLG
jgi:hypothetical protein